MNKNEIEYSEAFPHALDGVDEDDSVNYLLMKRKIKERGRGISHENNIRRR